MKKEIIISAIIVLIIILLNIITQTYTYNSMTEIEEELVNLRKNLENENEIESQNEITIAKKKWDEKKEKLVIYLEHDELEKVEMYIIETNSHIETKEYKMAIQSLDTCKFIIEHIKEKYDFSWRNIF